MLAKKTSKNQITLPKDIVQKPEDVKYFEVSLTKGRVVLKPIGVNTGNRRLKPVRAKIKALGVTEKDIEKAIRWARNHQS
jgi:hypothetical protein